jgi:flagellar hook-associated protein 3 FlgL
MLRVNLPDILMTQRLTRQSADLKVKLQSASEEMVTGRRADVVSFLDGKVGQSMLVDKALNDVIREMSDIALRNSRLDTMQNSLSSVSDTVLGLDIRTYDAIAGNKNLDLSLIGADARQGLGQVFDFLNIRFGERYAFSGDASDRPPFGSAEALLTDVENIFATATNASDLQTSLDSYFDDPAGPFQTVIYQGGAPDVITSGVTGLDPALADTIRGLAVLAMAAGNGSPLAPTTLNSAVYTDAASSISNGIDGITNLKARLGIEQGALTRNKQRLDSEQVILNTTLTELTGRDQNEAAIELKQLEVQLEATYILTNRLSSLTLLNYLR